MINPGHEYYILASNNFDMVCKRHLTVFDACEMAAEMVKSGKWYSASVHNFWNVLVASYGGEMEA